MRIGADQCIREKYPCLRPADRLLTQHALSQIFEIDLMNNPDAGRHQLECFECLLAPFEELISLPVAFELHLEVQPQCLGGAKEVDLDRVIDDQIDRDQWFNNVRIPA